MASLPQAARRSLAYLLLVLGALTLLAGAFGLSWASSQEGIYATYYAPYALLKDAPTLKAYPMPGGEWVPGLEYRVGGAKRAEKVVTKLQKHVAGRKGAKHSWRGIFKAPTEGLYTFRLEARQGAALYIDGVEVLGMSAKGKLGDASNEIPLEAGIHGIELVLFPSKRASRQSLGFTWTAPKGTPKSLDGEHFKAPKDAGAEVGMKALTNAPAMAQDPSSLGTPPFYGEPLPGLAVPTMRILTQPYRLKWPYGAYKFPTHLYDAVFYIRGMLRVEAGDGPRLGLEGQGWAQVWLDDKALFPAETGKRRISKSLKLAPGDYPITLAYRGEGRGPLNFGPVTGSTIEPFSAERFQLSPEDHAQVRSARAPPMYGVLALALGLLVLGTLMLRGQAPSLFEFGLGLKERRVALGLTLLVALAAALRLYEYTLIPAWGETMDEYANAWNGWNMWHGEGPKAWSPFRTAYEDIERVLWMDNWFNISAPYVDRPPLFAALLGLVLTLAGTPDFFSADLAVMRLLPITLSVLTVPLVFDISRRLYGEGVGWVATLFFVTSPLIIWTQRLAKSESLLALLWCVAIWMALKGVEAKGKGQRWMPYFVVGLICAGLSPWCKEVGIAAIPIVAWVWWRAGYRREGVALFVIAGVMAALYPVYGVVIAGDVFWGVLDLQGHKKTAFNVGFELLTVGKATYLTLDGAGGFMLFLWFTAAATLQSKERLPHGAVGLYLVLLAPLVATKAVYGWYRLPLYPFLVMTLALFLRELWRRPNILGAGLFLLSAHWMTLLHFEPLGVEVSHGILRGMAGAVILGILPAQLLGGRPALALGRLSVAILTLGFMGMGFVQLYYQLVAYRV